MAVIGTLDFTQFRAQDGSHTKRRIQGVYTPPNAEAGGYPSGGDPLGGADIGLGQLHEMDLGPGVTAGGVLYQPVYDYVNNKVRVFVGTTGLEVGTGVDISTVSFRFEAIGL